MRNETKHTPGPWEASDDCMEISPSTGPKSHVELARIVGPGEGSSFYTYDEASANARLIAAAPDLLAALKQAEASYRVQAATLRARAEIENRKANSAHASEVDSHADYFARVITKAEGR